MRLSTVLAFIVISGPSYAADFYPLAKGNKWEFKLTVKGMEIDVVQEVTKLTEKKGEPTLATLVATVKDNVTAEVLSVDEKGVFRHSYNGVDLSTPITAIKLPAKSGTKWKDKIKLGQIELEMTAETLNEEMVTVAAGKFKAFPVKTNAEAMGQKIVTTSWYSDGVGLVKQEVDLNGIEVKMELKKFTPAK